MGKGKIISIGRVSKDGKFHFARFEDKSFLSLEPKGDNVIYVMCWSSMQEAVAYCTIANIPEDVGIVSIDAMRMPKVLGDWPDKQKLMLDRQLDGTAKVIRMSSVKEGRFAFINYIGEPPDVQPVPIDPDTLVI